MKRPGRTQGPRLCPPSSLWGVRHRLASRRGPTQTDVSHRFTTLSTTIHRRPHKSALTVWILFPTCMFRNLECFVSSSDISRSGFPSFAVVFLRRFRHRALRRLLGGRPRGLATTRFPWYYYYPQFAMRHQRDEGFPCHRSLGVVSNCGICCKDVICCCILRKHFPGLRCGLLPNTPTQPNRQTPAL